MKLFSTVLLQSTSPHVLRIRISELEPREEYFFWIVPYFSGKQFDQQLPWSVVIANFVSIVQLANE